MRRTVLRLHEKVAIATPVRGANPRTALAPLGYGEFIRRLCRSLPALDPVFTFTLDPVRARNRLAAQVLRDCPQAGGILWIDDDEFFEDSADGVRVISEMLATNEDLIGVPYTNKHPPIRWVHELLPTRHEPDERGCLRVAKLGFGMTYTSRAGLEAMARISRLYRDWPHPHKIPDLFLQVYEPHGDDPTDAAKLSEDFSFCYRWGHELGRPVYLYARSGVVMHAGSHAWSARDLPGGVRS